MASKEIFGGESSSSDSSEESSSEEDPQKQQVHVKREAFLLSVGFIWSCCYIEWRSPRAIFFIQREWRFVYYYYFFHFHNCNMAIADDSGSDGGQDEEVKGQGSPMDAETTPVLPNTQDLFGGDSS